MHVEKNPIEKQKFEPISKLVNSHGGGYHGSRIRSLLLRAELPKILVMSGAYSHTCDLIYMKKGHTLNLRSFGAKVETLRLFYNSFTESPLSDFFPITAV